MPDHTLASGDFEALLTQMPHAVCVLAPDGAILWANAACGELAGASVDALTGADFLAAVCGDEPAELAAALAASRSGVRSERVLAPCGCDGAATAWIEWRFVPCGEERSMALGREVSHERRRGDTVGELRLLEDEAERIAGLGSWRLDLTDGGFSWSPEMYRVFGVDPADDLDLAEVTATAVHPDDRAVITEINRAMLEGGEPRHARYRIVLPDGTWKWVFARGRQVFDEAGRPTALIGFVQDVTERVHAEEALRASGERYRAIIDGMQDAYFHWGNDAKLVMSNLAAARMFGYDSPAQMVGTSADVYYADDGERQGMLEELRTEGSVSDRIGRGRRRDGTAFWVSLNVGLVWDENGAPDGTEGFARDITDRVKAEEAERASMSLLRATLESTADGILAVDRAGSVTNYNARFAQMWGVPEQVLETRNTADIMRAMAGQLTDPEGFVAGIEQLRNALVTETFDTLELLDGRVFERLGRPQMLGDEAVGRVMSFRDVTERVRSERALRLSEEDLREAQEIARIGSYGFDITTDRWTSSETMDEIFGIGPDYVRDFAGWVALVHEDDRAMMTRYFTDDVVGQNLPFDKQYRVVRHSDGGVEWVHGVGRLERDAGGQPLRMLGTIQDITRRHENEESLRRTNESLERMVYEVAEAMGRVIEIRDQYTKGHQERTARVATAIAREMGLPPNDVAAVEMAAVVHDIGKLSVPAEILSRPTRLSELEMALIREHPRNGYEILKDIPFPWPVAEIVLQHHERMDGSGYPAGLTAGRIIPLARVLAVADVVEAMATHRPYRAALGLCAALAELRDYPEKYDPAVVEACIAVCDRGELGL